MEKSDLEEQTVGKRQSGEKEKMRQRGRDSDVIQRESDRREETAQKR